MATSVFDQPTTETKLIWLALVGTYPCYLIGGLYILGSVLGWMVFGVLMLRYFIEGKDKDFCFPLLLWVWIVGMVMMLVALLVAHIDRELGTGKTIKSSIGWAKGWALIALFPVLGALVPFKIESLTRGCCIIALHSFIFTLISLVWLIIGLPGDIFVSPLKVVGGPGDEFFTVRMFAINPETGLPRWSYFGPWAPASGLLACMYLIICSQEKNRSWFWAGMLGSAAMCIFSQSRAGWVIYCGLVGLIFFHGYLRNPWILIGLGLLFSAVILLGQPFFEWVMDSYQQIKDSRPDSTRVRGDLAEIAIQRWQSEAPVWGHGIVEEGPKKVEHMPIGSHHSWYGLLFVKGWVGALALAVPFACTIVYLLFDGIKNQLSRVALVLMGLLFGYSFFENLEILVYLFWPALIYLGAALNPLKREGVSYEKV